MERIVIIISMYIAFTAFLVAYTVMDWKTCADRRVFSFVGLLIAIIHILSFVIANENLHFVLFTKDISKYVAFLLFRTITLPFTVLLGIQFIHHAGRTLTKLLMFFCTWIVLILLDSVSRAMPLYSYADSGLLWPSVYYASLLAIGYSFHWLAEKSIGKWGECPS